MKTISQILRSCTAATVVRAAFGVAWAMPGMVHAGTQTGLVTSYGVRASDGLIHFYLAGSHDGRPGCASQQPYWIVKDENSNTGKRQLALLMLAQSTHQPVKVTGLNTCTRWPDGEDVDAIEIDS